MILEGQHPGGPRLAGYLANSSSPGEFSTEIIFDRFLDILSS